ncbi:23S rRNA (pseudouridine(1915)-N(3))-methyltransferase RlmH [Eudoraea chungangensis]|uniref:23S rRNA (pseudouridine(1915)-N(3))-methyltransferase RlmH n=1 Tax=Eudoraea chungangensis TaxID=1481905 RepID=UPI0023EB028B|nr:23S rRNA (pseudouridine(1915)-N(3))-methyltransferase RlmH [Eudoraea chungangensis]
MRIKIIAVGKTDQPELQQLIDLYLKRLAFYVKIELLVLNDVKNSKNLSNFDQMNKEAELISKHIQKSDMVFILDEKGKEYSSKGFAQQLQKVMNMGTKQLVLIIGGPYGFSQNFKKKANGSISLSKLTFSHQMVRLFLVEQLYRGYSILNNQPYHHE